MLHDTKPKPDQEINTQLDVNKLALSTLLADMKVSRKGQLVMDTTPPFHTYSQTAKQESASLPCELLSNKLILLKPARGHLPPIGHTQWLAWADIHHLLPSCLCSAHRCLCDLPSKEMPAAPPIYT